MNRRYNPSCPPPLRPQRGLEGWMVLAIAIGLVLGGAGLAAKAICGALTNAAVTIEHAGGR